MPSDIRVQINSVDFTQELACIRDGTTGSATLAPELLSVLPAGAAFFAAFPIAAAAVDDGTTHVDVLAASRASTGSINIMLE